MDKSFSGIIEEIIFGLINRRMMMCHILWLCMDADEWGRHSLFGRLLAIVLLFSMQACQRAV